LPEKRPLRSDWVGSLIGLVVFVAGIGLLAVTFQLAFSMFTVPPNVAMGDQPGKSVDLVKAGESLASVAIRVMLLFVMCVVGSVVANRGIRLYVSCRHPAPKAEEPAPREESKA
jgi:hypothetical protein